MIISERVKSATGFTLFGVSSHFALGTCFLYPVGSFSALNISDNAYLFLLSVSWSEF